MTKTVTVTASPTGPTAPTYTQTSRHDNTSPYTVISQGGIQAPVNVRGGKLDLETDLLETTTTTTGHKAKWGGTAPNARGRCGGRWPVAIGTTTTQAGGGAPIAITTRKSDGTKSQLSGGPVSPDPDLAGSRERADMSPFKVKSKVK